MSCFKSFAWSKPLWHTCIAVMAVLATAILYGNAQAAPVNYNENVSGQLTGGPYMTFQFDEGQNNISGTTNLDTSTIALSNIDQFDFIVSTGDVVTSITYSYNITNLSANVITIDVNPSLSWVLTSMEPQVGVYAAWLQSEPIYKSAAFPQLYPTLPQTITASPITEPFYARSVASPDPTPALPLSEGLYSFMTSLGGIGYFSTYPATASWDYTLTFEVAPAAAVPEPETYAMLLAGLGLLGFMATRRGKKKLPFCDEEKTDVLPRAF